MARESTRTKRCSDGQAQYAASIGKSGQVSQGGDGWSGNISKWIDQPSERVTPNSSANVRLLCEDLIVERSEIADVSPHLDQHHAKVFRVPSAPLPEGF